MRELSISELEVVVGGTFYMEQTLDNDGGGGGSYSYGESTFTSYSDGSFSGDAYQGDSAMLQNEAQAMSIDWEVGGEYSGGGGKIYGKISGKS